MHIVKCLEQRGFFGCGCFRSHCPSWHEVPGLIFKEVILTSSGDTVLYPLHSQTHRPLHLSSVRAEIALPPTKVLYTRAHHARPLWGRLSQLHSLSLHWLSSPILRRNFPSSPLASTHCVISFLSFSAESLILLQCLHHSLIPNLACVIWFALSSCVPVTTAAWKLLPNTVAVLFRSQFCRWGTWEGLTALFFLGSLTAAGRCWLGLKGQVGWPPRCLVPLAGSQTADLSESSVGSVYWNTSWPHHLAGSGWSW